MTANRAPSKIIPRAFPGIKPDEVEELIATSKVNTYPAGTILCRENSLETIFYMILEGDVEVTKVINQTEARVLKTLSAGDFFGEMALIHNAPRAATVTTKSDVVVLELDKESFDRVLQHSSSVAMAMVREISERLRQNDEMAIEDLRMRAGELGTGLSETCRTGFGTPRIFDQRRARTPHSADGSERIFANPPKGCASGKSTQ